MEWERFSRNIFQTFQSKAQQLGGDLKSFSFGLKFWIWYSCYKLIQRFRVTGLFTGQYTTGYYGTFTDVK